MANNGHACDDPGSGTLIAGSIFAVRNLSSIRLSHWWRAFFVALAIYAGLGLAILLFVPDSVGVFALGAYCIPANSVVPLPHEPALLYYARYYDPAWCALAATIGSMIACYADYAMVGAVLRHRLLSSTRSSRLFRWAMRWMRRWPFAITVLFSFTPLPIAVVRILAPAINYPIHRYMLAQIIGRFPRFYIVAWIGHTIQIPVWLIIAITVVLVGTFFMTSCSEQDDDDEKLDTKYADA